MRKTAPKQNTRFGSPRKEHPLAWLWEPMESIPGFELRTMFGVRTAYLDGALMLAFAARSDPWRGVLVCTGKEHHESLMREFPALAPHSILPKWLMLRESEDDFERVAPQLVALAMRRDPRVGIEPKAKRP